MRISVWFKLTWLLVVAVATGGIFAVEDSSAVSGGSYDTQYSLGQPGRYGRAIWSDGETLWLTILGGEIRGFRLSDMSRRSDDDIDGISDSGNDSVNGMWSDGEVMYTSDDRDRRLYAYSLNPHNYGDRLHTREFRPN